MSVIERLHAAALNRSARRQDGVAVSFSLIPRTLAITWPPGAVRQVDDLKVAAQVHGSVRPRRQPVGAGISSQVLPSNFLPVVFFRTPPHCLKKNGT